MVNNYFFDLKNINVLGVLFDCSIFFFYRIDIIFFFKVFIFRYNRNINICKMIFIVIKIICVIIEIIKIRSFVFVIFG